MSSNPFWDQQQQFFEQWNKNMAQFPGMQAFTDLYKNMMPNAQDYWKQFADTMSNPMAYWEKAFKMMPNPSTYWENMAKVMPSAADFWKSVSGMMPNAEAFGNLWPFQIPGMDTFNKVFDMWKDIGDPAALMKNFPEKYAGLMQDLFKNIMPAGGAQLFAKPQELLDTCVKFYQEIFSPWMQIDESIFQRIAAGDYHAYHDFFKDFNNKYEETFDKVFNMMGMGLNREANEDYMKAISAYIRSLFVTGELVSLVMETLIGSMKTLLERYQSNLNEGKMVTTFREFYDLWYNVTEEALVNLFNTDEFSKVFGNFSDRYAQYMVAMNRVYERMLAGLPIPTNKDMKSLYKTVYDLRKEVRDLRRKLDEAEAAAQPQAKQ